ncbi:MAG: hypothetical protein K9J48_03215 [Desulfohalobiaceae bacterium]|jgi:hypothetical protein|nr:hypothetical protein [Desulfohalobiaceae bacterium]
MTENQESQQRTMSWEEVAYSNMIQGEAFLRILVEKGVLTKEEFVEKLREVHKEYMQQKQEESGEQGQG